MKSQLIIYHAEKWQETTKTDSKYKNYLQADEISHLRNSTAYT